MNTSRTVYRARRGRERGSVAVELALILLATSGIMAAAFTYGRAMWQYNAVKNASNSAARYLIASGEWTTLGDSKSRTAAAEAVFRHLVAESGLAADNLSVTVSCPGACDTAAPSSVTLDIGAHVSDPFSVWVGDKVVPVKATAGNTD
jgi:Flp pilus assembly protein TadG